MLSEWVAGSSRIRSELPLVNINVFDHADVAVVDVLVIVVLDLHDLVARCEGPAEAFDLLLTSRVQRRLQFDVERACPDTAAVHWAKHLDVLDRVEAKAARDALGDQLDDARNGLFRIRGRHEVKICIPVGFAQIRNVPGIDRMRRRDDLALRRLAKDLGQPHNRHGAGADYVSQHLAGAHGG